jgi:hypothetical protein
MRSPRRPRKGTMWRERRLHRCGKSIHATAHIGNARRQPDTRTRRWDNHAGIKRNCTGSTMPVTRTPAPFHSIPMPDTAGALLRGDSTACSAGSAFSPEDISESVTRGNTAVPCSTASRSHARNCRCHSNTLLKFSPCACASSATEKPGSHAAIATRRRYFGT